MKEREESKKKRLPIWAKLIIAVGAAAVLLLTVFLLWDVPPFNEYRFFLHRVVNTAVNNSERTETDDERVAENDDFAELDSEIPFKVTRPMWLPEGFVLEYVDHTKAVNGYYTISYKYILNENDEELIEFNIRESLPIDPEGFTVDFEEISIDGMKVYILGSDEQGYSSEYMDNQGLVVTIGGTMNQETLIKIIENMS